MKLSSEFRNSLGGMAASYQAALQDDSPGARSGLAREYLAARGIGPEAIASFRLGMVDASHDEHAPYAGMICIPYITRLGGVVSLKFRRAHDCDQACEHAKYITPYSTRPYNTLAMDKADKLGIIALIEGEINSLTLDFMCGIPAVGIPGVKTWTHHREWREMFKGYPTVLVFPDADEAGEELAKEILKDIDTARLVRLPDGMDANKAYTTIGAEEIRRIANVG